MPTITFISLLISAYYRANEFLQEAGDDDDED